MTPSVFSPSLMIPAVLASSPIILFLFPSAAGAATGIDGGNVPRGTGAHPAGRRGRRLGGRHEFVTSHGGTQPVV